MAKKKLFDQEKIEQLQKQLKETQQQLKYANLKKEAYETVIHIAEEEFDITIVTIPELIDQFSCSRAILYKMVTEDY